MTSDCFTTFVYRRCLLVGALVNGAQEGKTILESQGGCHGQVVEKPIIHKCKQDIRFTCDGAYRYLPSLSLALTCGGKNLDNNACPSLFVCII